MLTGDLGLFVSETISRVPNGSGGVEGIDELKRLIRTDGGMGDHDRDHTSLIRDDRQAPWGRNEEFVI